MNDVMNDVMMWTGIAMFTLGGTTAVVALVSVHVMLGRLERVLTVIIEQLKHERTGG